MLRLSKSWLWSDCLGGDIEESYFAVYTDCCDFCNLVHGDFQFCVRDCAPFHCRLRRVGVACGYENLSSEIHQESTGQLRILLYGIREKRRGRRNLKFKGKGKGKEIDVGAINADHIMTTRRQILSIDTSLVLAPLLQAILLTAPGIYVDRCKR